MSINGRVDLHPHLEKLSPINIIVKCEFKKKEKKNVMVKVTNTHIGTFIFLWQI